MIALKNEKKLGIDEIRSDGIIHSTSIFGKLYFIMVSI